MLQILQLFVTRQSFNAQSNIAQLSQVFKLHVDVASNKNCVVNSAKETNGTNNTSNDNAANANLKGTADTVQNITQRWTACCIRR